MALKTQSSGHRGTCYTVLARSGLRYHALLTHMLGQKRLTNGVVHLMSAGVVEIFALEKNPTATNRIRQARRLVKW